jgi:hypothetical protein
MARIDGRAILPSTHVPSGQSVFVVVEDTSFADAAATPVARGRFVAQPQARVVRFGLELPPLQARAAYTVRVHVDMDGDGRLGVGDLHGAAPLRPVPGIDVYTVDIPLSVVR